MIHYVRALNGTAAEYITKAAARAGILCIGSYLRGAEVPFLFELKTESADEEALVRLFKTAGNGSKPARDVLREYISGSFTTEQLLNFIK